jgi:hypothetical protein
VDGCSRRYLLEGSGLGDESGVKQRESEAGAPTDAGLTQWTECRNYEDYLAWRTEHGFTGTFEAMLTRPLVIHYYDTACFGEGIAARQSVQR